LGPCVWCMFGKTSLALALIGISFLILEE